MSYFVYGTDYYGIKPMPVEDEINLPEYVKQTRQNKIKIVGTCDNASRLIETIKNRAKNTPELDDATHAALVQELANKVNELYKAVEAAVMVGYR